MQQPTIGRIVVYNTTRDDRDLFANHQHGNAPSQLPAIIVGVWNPTLLNLQVFIDTNQGIMWKTSITQGDNEGQWNWPKRN